MYDRNDNVDTQAGIAEAAAAESNAANAIAGVPPDAPVVEAATLFGRHRQVVIGHNGCATCFGSPGTASLSSTNRLIALERKREASR